ncbi:DUF2795 domain-containing protein [Streptomyces sp. SLBN-31]|uniref:DUF2795 domain-containing protein n=1 Tax=Streptomyces sp. SLBN-31 TaxID=2768444 RepID=UPI001154CF20|nr:DUF2795 domain-containing protein [Streptomyces sp. SLBN-31]TQJ91240.1 uncharacterized protein DUF2795 [Streptomyces sp. SLBN-31]
MRSQVLRRCRLQSIDLQKALSGVDYPADRDHLVGAARDNNAPDGVVNALSEPSEEGYETPAGVSKAVFSHS